MPLPAPVTSATFLIPVPVTTPLLVSQTRCTRHV
jgi:hypothetical protein